MYILSQGLNRMRSTDKILVVGAAIARTLAEAGYGIRVIDKRGHIGGNAFDNINEHGERIHRYGPHLMHGHPNGKAVRWLSQYTEWIEYEHRVRALLADGRTTPLPVNRTTLEDIFGCALQNDHAAEQLLAEIRSEITEPTNTDEFFLANVGEQLADLFFRPYTLKMWGRPANELAASIGARLPVRTNRDDRYFTDGFQALPKEGYTALFNGILNHPNIDVQLGHPYEAGMEKDFLHSFLSVAIDNYFDYAFGELPYRSVIFHTSRSRHDQAAPVINFTDTGRFTRSTQWDLLPNSSKAPDGMHSQTIEEPCSIKDNPGEYYYPVQTESSKAQMKQYQSEAHKVANITFIGRTGLFRYIDMLPAVTMHLDLAEAFLKDQGPA